MHRPNWIALLAIVASTTIGCGGGEETTSAVDPAQQRADQDHAGHDHANHNHAADAHAGQASQELASIPEADAKTPTSAVYQFLEAVRLGQKGIAASLMTKKAQLETQRPELFFSPAGNPTARFRLAEPQMVSENAATVACEWTETVETGQPQTNRLTWLVSEINGQWRIYGMRVKMFEDMEPFVLNFEDADAIMQEQNRYQVEMERRQNEVQAQQPASGERTAQLPAASANPPQ